MRDKLDGLQSVNFGSSPGGMASDLADDNEFLMMKAHHNLEMPVAPVKKH